MGQVFPARLSGKEKGGDINIEASESIGIVGTGFEEVEQTFISASLQETFNPASLGSGTGMVTSTIGRGTAGNINLDTSNLSLEEGAVLGNFTFGEGAVGNLRINSADSVEVSASIVSNFPARGSKGNGNIIEINTSNLTVRDTGVISSVTSGSGNGGNILINATEQINLLRSSNLLVPTGIFSNSLMGTGNAGDIIIKTQKLKLQDGAQLSTQSGGFIPESILSDGMLPDGIFDIFPDGILPGGPAGNLDIKASDSVDISGGGNFLPSSISSASFTSNDAGNITVSTQKLNISEGGGILTSTIGSGNSGNLTIDAAESITISETSVDGRFVSSILSASGEVNSAPELDPTAVTGDAGSLSITTDNLLISDKGIVAVNSLGQGDAGNLEVQANNIQLDNQGRIIAETDFGEGGNISLDLDQSLILRHGSLISAKAENNANGGNIKINASDIIAPPFENSDITANAFDGNGGKYPNQC